LQPQNAVERCLVELTASDKTSGNLPLDLSTLEFNDHGASLRPPAASKRLHRSKTPF
jgi:hypothetical protein